MEIACEVGANAVSAADAVKNVDVIIVAIPTKAIAGLDCLFHGVPKNVVVIDACNYYPLRDWRIERLEQGTLESMWVCEQLGRPVVKAFNTISFPSLATEGLPSGTAGRIALPVGGDDEQAKALVFGLVDAAGFDAVMRVVLVTPGGSNLVQLSIAQISMLLVSAMRSPAPTETTR